MMDHPSLTALIAAILLPRDTLFDSDGAAALAVHDAVILARKIIDEANKPGGRK